MILMYHNLVPPTAPAGHTFQSITLTSTAFERQLRFLSRHYDVLPMDAYLAERWQTRKTGRRALAITFDDGTAMTYQCMLGVINELQVPVTIFVSTCQLDDGPLIWGSYLNALCFEDCHPSIEMNGRRFELISPRARQQAHGCLHSIARSTGDPVGVVATWADMYPIPPTILQYYQGMTSQELRQAGADPLVEIGAHTVNHPFLTDCTQESELSELNLSRETLEQKTHAEVRFFAYPCGEYCMRTIQSARLAGFSAAFSVQSKQLGEPDFEVPRVGVFSSSMFKLRAKLWLHRNSRDVSTTSARICYGIARSARRVHSSVETLDRAVR